MSNEFEIPEEDMTFDEYQSLAVSTAIYDPKYSIMYPALGLTGEAGEVAEKIKKYLRDGKLDHNEVAKELGDVLWYIAALARDLGFTLGYVAHANIDKLKSRRDRSRLQGSGDNR